MSLTLKVSQDHEFSSDDRRTLLHEITELTGERFTLENRLQWVDNRLDALRLQLHKLRYSDED